MTDARCEPPPHLRGVDGWHWLHGPNGNAEPAHWAGGLWTHIGTSELWYAGPHELSGWRYVAPVPSPEAVARLVEAGLKAETRIVALYRGIAPAANYGEAGNRTADKDEVLAAIRAALAAFPEERT